MFFASDVLLMNVVMLSQLAPVKMLDVDLDSNQLKVTAKNVPPVLLMILHVVNKRLVDPKDTNAQKDSQKLKTKERNVHFVNYRNVVYQLFQPRLALTNLLDADMDSLPFQDLKKLLAELVN
jgi:hypothetical protein